MNTIKKIFLFLAVVLTAGVQMSCTDYQDEIDALDYRVTVLENLVKTINTNLDALQKIVDAMDKADYITNVSRTPENDGYIITFHHKGAIIVKDGRNGVNGQNGSDATMPNITLEKDTDGKYYWKLNGEWLLDDATQNKICANGKDGVDGKAPKVKIDGDTNEWMISYDNGVTWIPTGTRATGKDGKDGQDGKPALVAFVEVTTKIVPESGEKYVIFTAYSDKEGVPGQTFAVPMI